jgi:hypothetical protein
MRKETRNKLRYVVAIFLAIIMLFSLLPTIL